MNKILITKNKITSDDVKISGNIITFDQWEFDDWGNLAFNTTIDLYDLATDSSLGLLSSGMDLLQDSFEIFGNQYKRK